MKKFLMKIFCFISIFILSWLLILFIDYSVIGNQYMGEYSGIFVYKMDRLMSIDEPKIILIGDSNVAYGFNSKMLEEEFGMPVVNLGLHGALGEYFHWMMAKNGVGEGDIVIYAGTSSFIKCVHDARLAWVTMEFHTDYYDVISEESYFKMALHYPNYAINAIWKYIAGNRSSSVSVKEYGFNDWGDVAFNCENNEENQFFVRNEITLPSNHNDNSKEIINEINEYCESKGATFLIAGYPIGINGEINDEQYQELCAYRSQLQEDLDCQVISNYENYLIDYKLFYDTFLHLSSEGAVIRTEQLIQDLRDYGLENYINIE